jgi:hypothetical protein
VRRRILDTLDVRTEPTYLSTDNNIIFPRYWDLADRYDNILCLGDLAVAGGEKNIGHPRQ